LALAIGHNRHVNNVWQEKDLEVLFCFISDINGKVYLVGIHHDRLYVTAAEFPKQYFNWVNDEIIPLGGCLVVLRRSGIFDLSKPRSRKEACRLVLGMLRRMLA